MHHRNGQIGQNGGGSDQQDMVCRSIVAAIAAMLALKLCQYLHRLING